MDNDSEEEILHLFDYLKASNCEFYRNGTWFSPQEAAAHLERKYNYLLDRRLVHTTEQFIDRAASRSSMSGQPYLVKCGDSSPVKSSDWFTDELKKFRQINHSKSAGDK